MNQVQNESINLNIGIPKLYKLREIIIANLMGLFPSIVACGLFGAGLTGFLGLIILLFLGIIRYLKLFLIMKDRFPDLLSLCLANTEQVTL